MCVSVCLSVRLAVCLSGWLALWLAGCLSVCLSVWIGSLNILIYRCKIEFWKMIYNTGLLEDGFQWLLDLTLY